MGRPTLAGASLVLAVLLVLVTLDNAEPGPFRAGFLGSIIGLRHFLIFLGFGVWAGRHPGSQVWSMPAAYIVGIVPGFVFAVGQAPSFALLVILHVFILVFLLLLTAAILMPVCLRNRDAITAALIFGALHGFHVGLDVTWAVAVPFGLGALLSAAALLVIGISVGRVFATHS